MKTELLKWLNEQLPKFRAALASRNEMARTWGEGTSLEWRRTGCRLTKEQRLIESDKHKRIAAVCRRDVEMCEEVIRELSK